LLVREEDDFLRAKCDVNGARNATAVDATPITTINNNERGMIAQICPSNGGKCDQNIKTMREGKYISDEAKLFERVCCYPAAF
jgi:hypothetical protein